MIGWTDQDVVIGMKVDRDAAERAGSMNSKLLRSSIKQQ
jgi:hypothetical protein